MRLFKLSYLWAIALLFVVSGCGGGGGSDDDDESDDIAFIDCADDLDESEFMPAQTFSDDFNCGRPGNRWTSDFDAIPAGALNPETEAPEFLETASRVSAKAPPQNFLLQSPDPFPTGVSGSRCASFEANFEAEGTFAFDYFVHTKEYLGSFFPASGNSLRVHKTEWSRTWNADFEDWDYQVIGGSRTELADITGMKGSRFIYRNIQPGFYSFEMCYQRRTNKFTDEDFVQIDNVNICSGDSCAGEVPGWAKRCRIDQGNAVVHTAGELRYDWFSINRVQGSENRYYVIIDSRLMDFILNYAIQIDSDQHGIISDEIDGMKTLIEDDGESCDLDRRNSLLIEMTPAEMKEFALEVGLVAWAFNYLEEKIVDAGVAAGEAVIQKAIDKAIDKIVEKIVEKVRKVVAKQVAKLVQKIVAKIAAKAIFR